jgi:hypothetical protein
MQGKKPVFPQKVPAAKNTQSKPQSALGVSYDD